MLRRSVLASASALGGLAALQGLNARPAQAAAPAEIQFWHGLPQPLGGLLEKMVADFNASQPDVKVIPTFRGSYPETMVATIAAFRANSAPHVVQMFEVGTGTMLAAGRAIKPVHQLLTDTGVAIDFGDYLPPVRDYYSSADGKQMSMPFNSSTSVMFYNKDHFAKAGLDPEKPPTTWEEMEGAMRKLKAAGFTPLTSSWLPWIQLEQLCALHDIPLATEENGFKGLGASLAFDAPVPRKHMDNLVAWQKEGLFRYGGRDSAADALFPAGEVSMAQASSGLRARVVKEAKYKWGTAMLPYYKSAIATPRNSIIGGASFWAMNSGPQGGATGGRSAAEWKGVAEFFRYLSQPKVDAQWHMDTGYVPVRRASYALARDKGYYKENPGADVAIEQLLRGGSTTPNTRGIRLGGYLEIRTIVQEEMEKAFQGQQSGSQALQASVTRGNQVLRAFQRQNRG